MQADIQLSGSLGGSLQTLDSSLPGAERATSDFSLRVLDESFIFGSSADNIYLDVEDLGDQMLVAIKAAGARDLTALYFDLGYDGSQYTPVSFEPAEKFGPASQMLVFTRMEEQNIAYHGQVLVHPQDQKGFSGDGVLALARFDKSPAMPGRFVSSPPVQDASAAVLTLDSGNFALSWGYASQGDYDQNSETNAADLTPIAVHFKKTGPFDYYSVEAVVDGDSNGEINAADITPIGVNFKRIVSSYSVYNALTTDDYPAANGAASTIDMNTSVGYADAIGDRISGRLMFSLDLTGLPLDEYYWVRPADAGEEGTPSNNLLVESAPLLPVVVLTAEPVEGSVPLTVNFDASGSYSPLGDLADFEWDFDNNGEFNESGNGEDLAQGQATASQDYPDPAVYDVAVRITGPHGLTAVGTVQVLANVTPPTADITGAPLTGKAPLTINFDASGSSDPDGDIVLYEWDYDGDGTYDADTGNTPTTSFEFATQGTYDTTVRVTDNHGATDTASMSESGGGTITILPPNVAPVAALAADTTSGPIPLTVNYDASASIDIDGAIVSYEWDLDGNGSFETNTGTTPNASFTYLAPGNFDPAVKVTDDDGATDTAFLSDTVTSGLVVLEPPVAMLSATPTTGDAPLTVDFDASASTDDGSITSYDWDLDFDGIFETNTGTTATVSNTYAAKGTHTITVRVTDNDGLTDDATVDITLTTGFIFGTIVANVAMDSKASIYRFGTGPGAKVGLAYKDALNDDLYFVESTDDTASAWNSPMLVLSSGQVGNDCTLREVNGKPAISFKRAGTKLHYIQATAADGSTWPGTSIEVDNGSGAGAFTWLEVLGGIPSIIAIASAKDELRFARAQDADGAAWNTPIVISGVISGGDEMEFTSMVDADGFPGVAFNFVGADTGLKFVRSTDANGTAWGSTITIDAPGGGGRYPALCTVSSNPAVSYNAFTENQLRFARATDAQGSAWGSPVIVDSGTDVGQWNSMCISGGVPVAAYYDGGNMDLKFATANDALGTAWTTMTVDHLGNVGMYATMTVVNDRPVIAYYDSTNSLLKIAVFD